MFLLNVFDQTGAQGNVKRSSIIAKLLHLIRSTVENYREFEYSIRPERVLPLGA